MRDVCCSLAMPALMHPHVMQLELDGKRMMKWTMILISRTGSGWTPSIMAKNGCHTVAWNCSYGGLTLQMQRPQTLLLQVSLQLPCSVPDSDSLAHSCMSALMGSLCITALHAAVVCSCFKQNRQAGQVSMGMQQHHQQGVFLLCTPARIALGGPIKKD